MTDMLDSARTARQDQLADQVFRSLIGAQETFHLYLGHKLGLYRALASVDSASPAELAGLAGIDERYAREWLEQQAVSGMLDVAADDGDAKTRRYQMPPGGAAVLCEPESLIFLAPVASLIAGIGQAMPQVVEAFRTGGGVPYEAYGEDLRSGIAEANRPLFANQLAAEWIPAMPDIERTLRRAEPAAHIADLGCGSGWSTMALAKGYPNARADGIDADRGSIEDARRNLAEHGAACADRISFHHRDASEATHGHYDLVTLFETLHDMAHPATVLRAARAMLAPGGAVLVGDEKVAETFTAPGEDIDRFNYGWSAPHCLPVALVEPDAVGTGTVIRPEAVRRYAREAGFHAVTELPIEHDLWRFYRLDP